MCPSRRSRANNRPRRRSRSIADEPRCLICSPGRLALRRVGLRGASPPLARRRDLLLALHAGLFVVLTPADFRKDTVLLDLLIEAAKGTLEGLVLADLDLRQLDCTPSAQSPLLGRSIAAVQFRRQQKLPLRRNLPPPLWGRVGVGGRSLLTKWSQRRAPKAQRGHSRPPASLGPS